MLLTILATKEERKAWRLIAQRLADPTRSVFGICLEIMELRDDRKITMALRRTMKDRLKQTFNPDYTMRGYWWAPGRREERVIACTLLSLGVRV